MANLWTDPLPYEKILPRSWKESWQDLFKILQESGQKSSNTRFSHGFGTRILQDKKDSCKFEKLARIWNRFLANLPNLETSWQDLARGIFDRVVYFVTVAHPQGKKLIKYAHVLICICPGKGSWHFSVDNSGTPQCEHSEIRIHCIKDTVLAIQWNPTITDALGSVLYTEVSAGSIGEASLGH